MSGPICTECLEKYIRSKYSGPCTVCNVGTCPKHTYFYTDESNGRITDSARPKCKAHK